MRKTGLWVSAAAVAVGIMGWAWAGSGASELRGTASFKDAKGSDVGTATLTQADEGMVLVLDVKGLPPGVHAFHVHEKGVCEPPFQSAGGHFNPDKHKHGIANDDGKHAGDMPNIHVAADGTAKLELFLDDVTLEKGESRLLDRDGASLVVHAAADDYKSDPAGNAGDRIACAVIQKTPATK